jgi:hypothetical protein
MRQRISGLVAAIAVVTASAAPALACGGGLFYSCSPCGTGYGSPCAQTYVPAYTYYERLADPVQQYYARPVQHQYYYVNQGPTYTGPGAFAPYPTYPEAAVSGWDAYRHRGRHHVMHRYN